MNYKRVLHILMVLIFSIGAFTFPAQAAPEAPDCICVDIVVEDNNDGTYNVYASGGAYWWRITNEANEVIAPAQREQNFYNIELVPGRYWVETADMNLTQWLRRDECGFVIEAPPPPEEFPFKVIKFHDTNENGVEDQGEERLSDWTFSWIASNEEDGTATTNDEGYALIGTFELGVTITVTEQLQSGWHTTTANPQIHNMIGENDSVKFGNAVNKCPPEGCMLFLPLVNNHYTPPPPPVCTGESLDASISSQKATIAFEPFGSAQTYDFGIWGLGTPLNLDATRAVSWSVTREWYHYLPDSSSYAFAGYWPLNTEDWNTDPISLRAGYNYLIRLWYMDQGVKCQISGWIQWDPPEGQMSAMSTDEAVCVTEQGLTICKENAVSAFTK